MGRKKSKRRTGRLAANLERLGEQIEGFLHAGGDRDKEAPETQGSPETPAAATRDSVEKPGAPRRTSAEETEATEVEPGEPAQSGASTEPEAHTQTTAPIERPAPAVTVSEDGMEAVVSAIYPETTPEQVIALLQENGIVRGVDQVAVEKAIRTAGHAGKPVQDVIVARGTPPRPAPPPTLEPLLPGGATTLPVLDPVARLLETQDEEEAAAAAADLQVWRVDAGQVLARKKVEEGVPGEDVRGEAVPYPEPEETGEAESLQPGQGVELDADGLDYVAGTPGYAGLLHGRIAVLAPVWIAPDEMSAAYLAAPPLEGSAPVTPQSVKGSLAARGVTEGIHDDAIVELCRRLAGATFQPGLAQVAFGREPTPPRDAEVHFTFPHTPQAGALREDGSVDFRERGSFPPVEKGALLAEMKPPVPGTAGRTVCGNPVDPEPPRLAKLVPGDNVREQKSADTVQLFADIDGGASVQTTELSGAEGNVRRYTVSVRQVVQIPGDIDYETGNLDFRGNVEVKGSVRSGFKLRATGAVNIAGSVDAGATVHAGGDLTVGRGIVGEGTRVVSGGALTVKYIQDARVETGGDLLVGSYIWGARVRAKGTVIVEGRGGSRGGIVGGETWGMQGVRTPNIGSPRSTSTRVVVGVDPGTYRDYLNAVQMVRKADVLLTNLLNALHLPSLDPGEVRKVMARNPRKRKLIVQYLQKASKVNTSRQHYLEERERLAEELAGIPAGACLEVQNTAYARVHIRIGNEEMFIQEDSTAVRYQRGEDGGIAAGELSAGS